ncbi:tumor necrosis factor receptor superfamily member 6B [Trichosurus vulpecula]|uniref:tumor necrosis factor receptor superfamily member 6B n=1 Tax=Trichosurus vulpecula TaxID=9337 RepID=UPI00186AF06C|nr:tumor necrosis factor receptor superfamily member 6B [Trichosurus vulpecula]XP_036604200.1 tumor necrosis factor receptor superfamily member 6B [Trichosurus vulpecula]XP_036604201.1 tumor necrosis factor receptor superfamily member 6B [Trichosurus vulpecula]XP_036604202.1 tumor necrosis factor receptor superfamily member 6B [Trichosurus vulpecula]
MDLTAQNIKFLRIVSTLLLLMVMPRDAGNFPTYSWRDAETQEWLLCDQCPPGTFVKHHCSYRSRTVCQPCPSLHYTQYWNYLEKCRYCNVFCGEHEEEAQACNATHNRACRCQLGYYAHADFCIEHSACPPGSGVVTLGTPNQNTQCQPCPKGTFSDNSSSTEKCQPHRNCTTLGMFLNVPGTSFHDAICTRCAGFLSSTPEPGDKECEQAVIDFVAFQNISLKRLMRLQQALEGPGSWHRQWPEPESRAAVQKELLHRLTELSETQGSSALLLQLLQALRKAKLTTLERNIQKHFSLDIKD